MKTVSHIDGVARRSAERLKVALENYLPSDENNMIAEQNAVLHMASELANEGWHIYGEAQDGSATKDDRKRRMDLLALRSRSMVTVEAKRLFRQPQQLVDDFRRVVEFKPRMPVPPSERLGMIIGVTNKPSVAEWFKDRSWAADLPRPWEGLGALQKAVRRASGEKSRWDAADVGDNLWLVWVVAHLR